LSGKLNEGMFRESYSFVNDLREERIKNLKDMIGQARSQSRGVNPE
jgi:hypothetical protein